MKKPDALNQLLEELQEEGIRSEVDVRGTSKTLLYLNDEAATREDPIELSGAESALLFASDKTVARFVEALEDTEEASLVLTDVTLPDEMLELLERNFISVDEG